MLLFALLYGRPSRKRKREVNRFLQISVTDLHRGRLNLARLTTFGVELLSACVSGFKDCYPEDLLASLFEALLQRTNLDPSLIGDVCIGASRVPEGCVRNASASPSLGDFLDFD